MAEPSIAHKDEAVKGSLEDERNEHHLEQAATDVTGVRRGAVVEPRGKDTDGWVREGKRQTHGDAGRENGREEAPADDGVHHLEAYVAARTRHLKVGAVEKAVPCSQGAHVAPVVAAGEEPADADTQRGQEDEQGHGTGEHGAQRSKCRGGQHEEEPAQGDDERRPW